MSKRHNKDVIEWKRVWNGGNLLLIVSGVALAALAMKGFMIPNKFVDGGITGISILLNKTLNIDISALMIGLNLVFIYLGYRRIGKTFAIQTSIAITLLALALLLPPINPITHDKLLIAIFGGILIGSG